MKDAEQELDWQRLEALGDDDVGALVVAAIDVLQERGDEPVAESGVNDLPPRRATPRADRGASGSRRFCG